MKQSPGCHGKRDDLVGFSAPFLSLFLDWAKTWPDDEAVIGIADVSLQIGLIEVAPHLHFAHGRHRLNETERKETEGLI